MDDNPWITHTSDVAYENAWIRVEHRDVTTPGGSAGVYGVVHFKNRAVSVVPIDDEDHTWLVGQHRYATNEYSWEVPEGGCPPGEAPEHTARRELMEETGITAHTLSPVFSRVHLSNSVSNEAAWGFVATNLEHGEPVPDDTEQLQLRRLPMAEAIDMALNGQITDALSLITLLRINADRTSNS